MGVLQRENLQTQTLKEKIYLQTNYTKKQGKYLFNQKQVNTKIILMFSQKRTTKKLAEIETKKLKVYPNKDTLTRQRILNNL